MYMYTEDNELPHNMSCVMNTLIGMLVMSVGGQGGGGGAPAGLGWAGLKIDPRPNQSGASPIIGSL